MDFNPQNTKKLSDQIRWISDDSGQARSYTCAFCKRGFSNAQALGGHMNIHRRDRAKLKQLSSEENLLSRDIYVTSTSDDDHQLHHDQKPSNLEEKVLFQLDSGEDKVYTNNHKQVININVSSAKVLPKIPFLAKINEETKIEIDLELRLGPEPHEASTLSTRENF